LRSGIQTAQRNFESAYTQSLAALEASDVWQRIDASDRTRILAGSGLSKPSTPDVSTDEKLLSTLETTPLSWWHDKIAALPGRFAQAALDTARLLEPKVQRVTLPSTTIRTLEELERWLAQARASIEEKLKDGPVVL
jgi:hypothetical protein